MPSADPGRQTSGRDVLLMFLLGAAVLASGIGLRDPWAPDEPRFALIARDMLISGDWLIPRVGGDLYPDKPPLFMWLVAAGTWLTGSLRTGFLLPSVLASLGTLWLVFDLARRLWDRDTAVAAGLVLLTVGVAIADDCEKKEGKIEGKVYGEGETQAREGAGGRHQRRRPQPRRLAQHVPGPHSEPPFTPWRTSPW